MIKNDNFNYLSINNNKKKVHNFLPIYAWPTSLEGTSNGDFGSYFSFRTMSALAEDTSALATAFGLHFHSKIVSALRMTLALTGSLMVSALTFGSNFGSLILSALSMNFALT